MDVLILGVLGNGSVFYQAVTIYDQFDLEIQAIDFVDCRFRERFQ